MTQILSHGDFMDYSFLVQQLKDNAERIRSLVKNISDEQSRVQPARGAWSILEVINHLYDEEQFDFRVRLGIILQHPEQDWPPIDPVGWVTERRYNERSLSESLENFLRERAASLSWLGSLNAVDWDTAYTRDGRTMLAGDMFASWVTHDHHHLRQLVELHRSLTEQAAQPYDLGYAGDW
ncbi:MAG: DinB family protein [Anaerolineales bacterium]